MHPIQHLIVCVSVGFAILLTWCSFAWAEGPPVAFPGEESQSVYRCEAILERPSGEQIRVPAWGPTTDLATSQAFRVARFLASQDLASDLIPGLLAEGEEGQLLLITRVGQPLGESIVGVPGYRMWEGECATYGQTTGHSGENWVVTWTAGNPEKISRVEPSSAIETARRRACLLPYQKTIDLILRQISQASQEDRDAVAIGGYEGALKSLEVCLTHAQPRILSVAEGAEPSEFPETLEVIEGDIDAVVPGKPWFECAASRMTMEGEWRTSFAWGPEVEWTAESALWELSILQARLGLAESLAAMNGAETKMKRMGISSGAARHTRVTAKSRALEKAGISCRSAVLDAGQDLQWRPKDVAISERCGPLDSWSRRTIRLEPDTLWTDTRHRLCQQMVYQSRPRAAELIAKAAEIEVLDQPMELWEHLIYCAARCAADAEPEGVPERPRILLSEQLDLSQKSRVKSRLKKAIARKDAEAFEICVPGLAIFRTVMIAQPERFWRDMSVMESTGQLYEVFAWEQYQGRWYLMPKD